MVRKAFAHEAGDDRDCSGRRVQSMRVSGQIAPVELLTNAA